MIDSPDRFVTLISLFQEPLMSQVVQQEALTRLLMEKGVFTKDEFLEIVKVLDREMRTKRDISDSVRIT